MSQTIHYLESNTRPAIVIGRSGRVVCSKDERVGTSPVFGLIKKNPAAET